MTPQQKAAAQASATGIQQMVNNAVAADEAAEAMVAAALLSRAATSVATGDAADLIAALPVPAVVIPAPAPQPAQQQTAQQPTAQQPVQQPPAQPATAATAVQPTAQQPVQQPPAQPATAATAVQPATAPAATAPAQTPNPLNPRNWNFVQWICAILVGLFAFWVARRTVGGVSDFFDLRGKPDWVLRAFWYVGVTGTGFFGTALLTVNAQTAFLRGWRRGWAQARNRQAPACGNQAQP